ncbi:MAG TPA: GNAT family N-acetyltransferase [Thermomicrobiaceae bacterium]|nr:GNAT family N-acetyltransferase [Thermomicrobiaceae bacterium]
MLDPDLIGFRGLEPADFDLIHRWLNTPAVLEWWKEPRTREEVEQEYGAYVRGEDPTRPFLILVGDRPIGYIQTYRIADEPEYARALDLSESSAGIDLYIGEDAYRWRGLGPEILRRFLVEVVFADPEIESCVIGPEPANVSAIRSYEKAGFRYLKTVAVPDEPEGEYLLRLGRAEALGRPAAQVDAGSGIVLHLTTRQAWERAAAGAPYRGDTLDREGFIHCSTPAQVVRVADAFYRGRPDLVLLCVDPARLSSELRWEAAPDGQRFPHVYGPIDRAAVVAVVDLAPGPDGRFTLPDAVSALASRHEAG